MKVSRNILIVSLILLSLSSTGVPILPSQSQEFNGNNISTQMANTVAELRSEKVFDFDKYEPITPSLFFDGANYHFNTTFGVYSWIQPLNYLSYVFRNGTEVIEKSVFVIQYESYGSWLPLLTFQNLQVEATNSSYRLSYEIYHRSKGTTYVVANVTIHMHFYFMEYPKMSLFFNKTTNWDLFFGDFRWIRDVVPTSEWKYWSDDENKVNVELSSNSLADLGYFLQVDFTNNPDYDSSSVWLSENWQDINCECLVKGGKESYWNTRGFIIIYSTNKGEIDPSTVMTGSGAQVNYADQRKSYFASGRHWVFYPYADVGTAIDYMVWAHSTDGVTWSTPNITKSTKSPSSTLGGWSNATDAYADGGNSAYITSGKPSANQTYYGYGFSAPANAYIAKVRVRLDAWTDGNEKIRLQVSADGGSTWVPASPIEQTLGVPDIYWFDVTSNASWTSLAVNQIRTKVEAYTVGGSSTVYLDWIPVEVTYSDKHQVVREITTVGVSEMFSIFFDGTYFHYVVATGLSDEAIYYRRATPLSTGNVTWSIDEQIAVAGIGAFNYLKKPHISVDSAGYPWITYENTTSVNTYPYVTKSSLNNGTWTTASGFPYELTNIDDTWHTTSVALNSQKVYVTYFTSGSLVKGKLWNSTHFGSEENASSNNAILYPVTVGDGDFVHLSYVTSSSPYTIQHRRRNSTGWETETTIFSLGTNYANPAMTVNSTNGDIYIFRLNMTSDHVYYKKFTNSSGIWGTEVDWIDESALGLRSNYNLVSFYEAYSNYIGLMYDCGSGASEKLRYAVLQITGVVQYLVTCYFNTGGTLLVNGTGTANGTSNNYDSGTILNLTAVANYQYRFKNHTYDTSSSTSNPFLLTISQDYTTHTYFRFLYDCNYIGVNNTISGKPTRFSSDWTDLYNAEGLSYHTYSDNRTGSWQNDTWSNSWTSTTWAVKTNSTLSLASGQVMAFRWFVNDSSGVEYVSTICFFAVLSDKVSPIARFNSTIKVAHINETLSFDASMSTDPDGGSLSNYSWNFGDGNTTSGSYLTITHKWTSASVYTINLTVTDDESATDSFTQTINITDYYNPIARFTFTPNDPETDEVITFDASNSIDRDGSITLYSWSFGASTSTTTKSYSSAGTYTVTLTVTDNHGDTDTFSQTISVSSPVSTATPGSVGTPTPPPTLPPPSANVSKVTFVVIGFPVSVTYFPWSNTFDVTLVVKNEGTQSESVTLTFLLTNKTAYVYWHYNVTFVLQQFEEKELTVNIPSPNEDSPFYVWIQLAEPTVSTPIYVGVYVQSFLSWLVVPAIIGGAIVFGTMTSGYGVSRKRRNNKYKKPRHEWTEKERSKQRPWE